MIRVAMVHIFSTMMIQWYKDKERVNKMTHVCKYCGRVIGVEFGHTMIHGNASGKCSGSRVMVAPTYGKG